MNPSSQLETPPKEQPSVSIEEKRQIEKAKINFLRQKAKDRSQKKKNEANTSSNFEDKIIDSKRSTPQWRTEISFQKDSDELKSEEDNLDTSFILNNKNSQDKERSSDLKINELQRPEKVLDVLLAGDKEIKSDPHHLLNALKNKIDSQNAFSIEQKSGFPSKNEEELNSSVGSLQQQSQKERFTTKKAESMTTSTTTVSDRLRIIEDLLCKIIEKQTSLEKRLDAIENNQADQALTLEDISRNLAG